MAGGISWHYVLKFIITGDAAVGKSSLLIRLTDQRFLANPDPTVRIFPSPHLLICVKILKANYHPLHSSALNSAQS